MNDNTFLDATSANNADTDQALRDAFGALAGAFAAIDAMGLVSAASKSAAAIGAPLLTVVSDPEVASQAADTEPPLHEAASGPRRHALRWALVAAALISAAIGGWAISRYRSDGPSVVRSVSPTDEGTGPSGGTVPPAILAEGNLVWVPEQWPEELANSPQTVGPGSDMQDGWERLAVLGPHGGEIVVIKRPAPAVTTTHPTSGSAVDLSSVNIETAPGLMQGTWVKDGSLFQASGRTPLGDEQTTANDSPEAFKTTIQAIAAQPWESLQDAGALGEWTALNEHLGTVFSTLRGGNLGAVVIRSDSSWYAGITTLSVADAPSALEELATAMGLSLEPIDDISTLADPKLIGGRLATAWAPDDSHIAVAEVVASSPGEDQEPAADQERVAAEVTRMIKSAHPTTVDKAGTWVDTREPNPGEFRNSGDETKILQQGSFPDGNKFRVYETVDSDRLQVEYLLADDSQMGVGLLVQDPSGDEVVGPSIDQWKGDGVYTEIAQLVAAGEHDPAKIKLTVGGRNVPLGGYYDEATDTTHAFGLVIKVPIDQRAQGGPYKDVVATLGD